MNEDIVLQVREDIEVAWRADQENRKEARSDLSFLAGKQWTQAELDARANRPSLTINKLPSFVRQITNDIKQNKPTIKVHAVDDEDEDDELADIFNGIIRQIDYRSSGGHVTAGAAFHTAACGIGHFRIKTQYITDAAFEQEILLERIPDPLSVYTDPAAVKPDRSDAMWRAVVEQVPIGTFEKRYPGAQTDSVDALDHNFEETIQWGTEEYVLVAEYWQKIPVKQHLALIEGATYDITEFDKQERALLMEMYGEFQTKTVDTFKVVQYTVSGTEVLEGPTDWLGKDIPIVTIVGEEIPVGDQIMRSGVVRHARDPQKLYNYWRSAAAEAIGQAPKTTWLATKKQIGRHRGMWDNANTSPRPYLLYDIDKDAPNSKPTRERPPDPPAAMWQESQIASDDIKATTGIYDASLGAQGNETSGKAIMARQREGDVANFHFTDNLQESLEHAGRILIDLIPKIYDSERTLRLLNEDDSEKVVRINQTVLNEHGKEVLINDLSVGRFDVRVSVGPGYTTKRMEAADSMMQFAQAVPAAAEVIPDLIAKNMDWPGADEIAERFRKMLPPNLLEDDEDQTEGMGDEAAQQGQPVPGMEDQPDPQMEMQQQGANLELQKMELENERLQLQNNKLEAEIDKIREQTALDRQTQQDDQFINGNNHYEH